MSRKSPRIILARAIIDINTSLTELRILRERVARRALVDQDQRNYLQNVLSRIDHYLASLEALSERLQTLLATGQVFSGSYSLVDLKREIRDLEKELKEFYPAVSLGLRKALEEIEEIKYSA